MFSHVMIGADDVDASKRFYDAALGALGVPPGRKDEKGRVFYMTRKGSLRCQSRSTASRRPAGTEARWDSLLSPQSRLMHGTKQGSKMVEQPSKTRREYARARPVSSIWLICAIQPETRSALCTEYGIDRGFAVRTMK